MKKVSGKYAASSRGFPASSKYLLDDAGVQLSVHKVLLAQENDLVLKYMCTDTNIVLRLATFRK